MRKRNLTQLPKPPDALSDLIDLAIADARSIDRSQYLPDWDNWHGAHILVPQVCLICLSGAVIAGTLKELPQFQANPVDYRPNWDKPLLALDEVRTGHYSSALEIMGKDKPPRPHDFDQNYPTPAKQKFLDWQQMDIHLASLEQAAAALRADGY